MPSPPFLELDVRPWLAAGRAPLGAVLDCVARLRPGQALRIIAPFEPVTLCAILGRSGFRAESSCDADGTWAVVFRR